MTTVNCYLPVTVRVTGNLADAQLDALGELVTRALLARMAYADHIIATSRGDAGASGAAGDGGSVTAGARLGRAKRLRVRGTDSPERVTDLLEGVRRDVPAFAGAVLGRIDGNALRIGDRSYALSAARPLAEMETVGTQLRGGAVYLAPVDRRQLGIAGLAAGSAYRVYLVDAALELHDTGMLVFAEGLADTDGILGYVGHTLRFADTALQGRRPRDTAALADAVILCIDNLPVTLAPLQTVMAILTHLEPEELTSEETMDILRIVDRAGRLTQLVSLIQIPRFRAFLRSKDVPWEYIYDHWEPGLNDSGQLWAGFVFGAAENAYEAVRFFYVVVGGLVSDQLAKEGREMGTAIKKFFDDPVVNATKGIEKAYADIKEALWNLEFFDAGRMLGNATVTILLLLEGLASLPKLLRGLGQITIRLARLAVREVLALGVRIDELGAFMRAPKFTFATDVGVTLIDAQEGVVIADVAGQPIGVLPKQDILMMIAAAGGGGAAIDAQTLAASLRKRGFGRLVDDVLEEMAKRPELAEQYLQKLERLGDNQLRALDAIREADEATGGIGAGRNWYDILDLPARFRNDLLGLVDDVRDSVRSGLAEAVGRGLRANATDPQGVLGHLYAARTLKQRFPGAIFDFEVAEIGREVDIRMTLEGAVTDVEVKTNLSLGPTIDDVQITKDLVRHAGDGWHNMLYLYAPQQAGNLASVQQAMLRLLESPAVVQACEAAGMTVDEARAALASRFADLMVGTFEY